MAIQPAYYPRQRHHIGDDVFNGWWFTTAFYFTGDAPALGLDVFLSDFYVTVYYLPGTTNWAPTFGGL